MTVSELDELCINTIRFLAVDAIQKANSGHPGAPLGAAPVAYVLWDRFLKHNPGNPEWADRDRFILDIALPPNVTATVYVPSKKGSRVYEGDVAARNAEGVKYLKRTPDAVVFHLAPGAYSFVTHGVRPTGSGPAP